MIPDKDRRQDDLHQKGFVVDFDSFSQKAGRPSVKAS